MLDEILQQKTSKWLQDLEAKESGEIFSEVPIPLNDFLYSSNFLNIAKLSPKQYEFIKYGTQIYKDKELEELKWDKIRYVGELVAYWGKGCFTGDTKVSLLTGKELSFEQLFAEYKDITFWVYSIDVNTGKIVPGLASNPRKTKEVTQLVEITLDNNEKVRCTLDHRFMLRDGTYREAKDLKENDSLMPLYRRIDNNYEVVCNPFDGQDYLTHRIMYLGDIYINNIIHHKDCDKRNNTPNNLELLQNRNKHFSLHNVIRNTSKQAKLAVSAKIKKLFDNSEYRAMYCKNMREAQNRPEVLEKIQISLRKLHQNKDFKEKFKLRMQEVCSSEEYKLHMSIVKKKWYEQNSNNDTFIAWKKERNLKANGLEANAKRSITWAKKREQKLLNHKVVTVIIVTLEKPVAVYDITVDRYHNFALSSGVFVHNSGKDMCSQIIQSRIAYLLLCLNNPQKYYDLLDVSSIDMLNMAYNADQAESVFFKTFSEMIDNCSWFKDKAEIKTGVIQFDKRIAAYSGNSYEEAFEGKNLIIAVLDEISAFKTKIEVEQMSLRRLRAPRYSAESVYDMAKSSIESRFGNGIGKLISLSFPRFKNDFIQQLYEIGKDEPTCYVSKGTTWEVNPYKRREDFNDEFRKNPERANARYGVNPSGVEGGYFKNKEAIHTAFPIYPIDKVPTTNDRFPIIRDWFKATHNFSCSIHIDLGLKQDKAGITMSHVSKMLEEKKKDEQGTESIVYLPFVEIDFITSFIAPINGEIDFSLIRKFIVDVINRGFVIGKLSLDSWQSIDFQQIMSKLGIEVETRSVDRNTDAYDCLKELVYDRRLKGYSYIRTIENDIGMTIQMNEVLDELNNLILIGGKKVEHPQYGCFTGDTRISLVDGREITILDALNEYICGKKIVVYAIDNIEKRIVQTEVKKVFKTKVVNQLVEITLDNNETIKCTPEHLFMLRDGTYREAKDLTIRQSLMPLYRKVSSNWKNKILVNHKVVNIRIIEGIFDVYDLEVPIYHNFALSAGVFVHNSKDISDSIAGSIQGAIEIGLSNFSSSDIMEGKEKQNIINSDYVHDREYLKNVNDDYFSNE